MTPAWNDGTVEARLAAADPMLAPWIDRVGPCAFATRPTESMVEALVGAIVHQQLSGKAASTILGRVRALGGDAFPSPQQLLGLPDEALRGAGLSGAKAAAVRDVATRSLDGRLVTLEQAAALDDDALVAALLPVRGIGRWSVEMVLMFRLGRPDVLPVNDLGIRKGFQRVYGGDALPDTAVLQAQGARWQPLRSAAAWYLWRVADGV